MGKVKLGRAILGLSVPSQKGSLTLKLPAIKVVASQCLRLLSWLPSLAKTPCTTNEGPGWDVIRAEKCEELGRRLASLQPICMGRK